MHRGRYPTVALDDLAGGVLRALLRVAGEFIAEVVLDRLVKTPG